MNKTMISVIYGSVLVMMITFAYLIVAEILLPGNMILVAVSVGAAVAALIADIMFSNFRKNDNRKFA